MLCGNRSKRENRRDNECLSGNYGTRHSGIGWTKSTICIEQLKVGPKAEWSE
jgi:hypothetical protein